MEFVVWVRGCVGAGVLEGCSLRLGITCRFDNKLDRFVLGVVVLGVVVLRVVVLRVVLKSQINP